MPKLMTLLRLSVLPIFFITKVAYSQYSTPPVSQQCWPAYSNYSNCLQMQSLPPGAFGELGSPSKSSIDQFCKNANEFWVSSGCAAQTQARIQCMQETGGVFLMCDEHGKRMK